MRLEKLSATEVTGFQTDKKTSSVFVFRSLPSPHILLTRRSQKWRKVEETEVCFQSKHNSGTVSKTHDKDGKSLLLLSSVFIPQINMHSVLGIYSRFSKPMPIITWCYGYLIHFT